MLVFVIRGDRYPSPYCLNLTYFTWSACPVELSAEIRHCWLGPLSGFGARLPFLRRLSQNINDFLFSLTHEEIFKTKH